MEKVPRQVLNWPCLCSLGNTYVYVYMTVVLLRPYTCTSFLGVCKNYRHFCWLFCVTELRCKFISLLCNLVFFQMTTLKNSSNQFGHYGVLAKCKLAKLAQETKKLSLHIVISSHMNLRPSCRYQYQFMSALCVA